MKKYIISSFVIVSFISYSFYQRVFGMPSTPAITIAHSTSKLSQSSPTATPIPPLLPTDTPTIVQTSQTQTIPTATTIPPVAPTSTPTVASGYKDGTYTGDPEDAFYGNIQVQATISGGRITTVQFLQAPNDRGTSVEINSQADPILAQEAIQTQNANVDIVSGATDSSGAFIQSLQSALNQAKG